MIPISLIISLEMVKMAQAFFISNDEEMYSAENDRYCKVFTSSLNEELGQIQFIFSDKTGTLTCNKMEFKICVVGDEIYGDTSCLKNDFLSLHSSFIEDKGNKKGQDRFIAPAHEFFEPRFENLKEGLPDDKAIALNLYDSRSKNLAHSYLTQYELVREFFLLLSLCHDCVVEIDQSGCRYQGESPDEIALVKTAAKIGFQFSGRNQRLKRITVFGKDMLIEELAYFPFNSDRKRASIIIRHEGRIKILMKGADSLVIDRLSHVTNDAQPYLSQMKKKLQKFSRKGLRTLCMSERFIS